MAKVTLQKVKGQNYFCSGRLSIGVYVHDNSVTLIDSGIDKDTAKYVHQALQESGYTVSAIINTHHHPDHCGGNSYFQKLYPALKIYASVFEKAFIEDERLGTICFCSGARPFHDLQNKYLQQEPSVVTHLITPYQDQVITIEGSDFRVVTLPGHTFGHIGVITPDNVLYCGDAIFGHETFEKHGMLLYADVAATYATFAKLRTLTLDACVFYHGGMIENIHATVDKHEARIRATQGIIYAMIQQERCSLDTLTQKVMQRYAIPETVPQFTLTKTSVYAFVSQLQLEKKVTLAVEQGMLWVVAI